MAFNVRLSVEVETRPITATNVVGLLPAASPTDESCVLGGHYEEIGPDPDGVVFPAGNDNASGTAVMLETARLLAEQSPPLRANILFMGWSGHEEGLHGSAYYLDNSVFPVAQTKCYINLDTVGQGGGQQLEAEIHGANMRSALEAALDRLEATAGASGRRSGSPNKAAETATTSTSSTEAFRSSASVGRASSRAATSTSLRTTRTTSTPGS